MDNATLIMIVSILLVLVVTGMIAFLVGGTRSAQKKRVMTVIRGETAADAGKKSAGKDVRRDMLARKLKENDPGKEEKKKSIPSLLRQAGYENAVGKFWILSFLLSAVLTFLVFLWGKGTFVIIMTAIIGFFGLPRMILKRMVAKRQKKFLADMPDVLEAMVRLLRAGMPVSEAVKMVAREFTGPIGVEMERIFDQQKIGVSLAEAVQDCARRMPLPEVQMFATAVSIQAQTGSSLSEVFESLAKVIRARFRLRRKVQALSAEAKASAAIIGALPMLVGIGMYFLNRDYISLLFTERQGQFMLAGAAFWMLLGILVMRQMINFKI